MNHRSLTYLILELNSMLDSGKHDRIGLAEVKKHIDDGTILRFIRKRGGKDIDLSILLDTTTYGNFEEYYVGGLQAILDGYGGNERRKWGVEKKGLCLLIAWTNEIIQQGSGWKPAKFARRSANGNGKR